MSKKLIGWVACSVCLAVASPGLAQDTAGAKSSVSVSTEQGASASASQDAGGFEPYEAGYPPDNNLLELGVFGGVLFPAKRHNLRDEHFDQHRYQNSPELGARLGWYPLSWVGIEGEAMAARSQ